MKKDRLITLRNHLQEKKLDAIFISAIPTISYLTDFSGFDNEDRNAFLLVTKTNQYIFTHGIYKEAAQKYIADFTLIDIARNQPMSTSLLELVQKHDIKQLGFEAANLTYFEYASLVRKIGADVFIPADLITEQIRIKKSTQEIQAIENACIVGDKAFTYLLTQIHAGITEKELALSYEIFVKKQGADISFDTIVAFGKHGSLPHHIPTDKTLTKNSFIVLDFGVKKNDYCSDMTRTVYFGKATDEEKHMYETVKIAQQKAIEMVEHAIKNKESLPLSQLDKVAREYILSQGYPDMPHSLGHGIGLEVHELPHVSPYSQDKITEGIVFSIEPGVYIPDIGGIRIEDLVAISPSGLKHLTNAPKELIELS